MAIFNTCPGGDKSYKQYTRQSTSLLAIQVFHDSLQVPRLIMYMVEAFIDEIMLGTQVG